MPKKHLWAILLTAWLIVITILSLYSFDHDVKVEFEVTFLDKTAHVVFHFVLVLLACLFIRETTKGTIPLVRTTFIALVFSVAYGILIEVLQYSLTKNRVAEVADIMANTIGGLLAIIVLKWYFSKKSPLKWKF
ncbi:MAG: VanZ family protein [Bacteroidota bacterium]